MKKTDKKEPIPTIPKGVWESSEPLKQTDRTNKTMDGQKNGYPSAQSPSYSKRP